MKLEIDIKYNWEMLGKNASPQVSDGGLKGLKSKFYKIPNLFNGE